MTTIESQPAQPPQRPRFQFSLRALMLLFVVLASSLAVFGVWGIVLFAVEVWFAVQSQRAKPCGYIALILIGLTMLLAYWPVTNGIRASRLRKKCSTHLKLISHAVKYYHDKTRPFPPAYTVDKNGNRLLSWRVLILPYLFHVSNVPLDDGDTLDKDFSSFNKSEPWDGPTNNSLSDTQMTEFMCPGDDDSYTSSSAQTDYLAVVGPGAAWTGDKPRSDADFHGEAANTIMIVEVANSGINWAEPRDLSVDALGADDGKSPAIVPSSKHEEYECSFFFDDEKPGINVAMADGSVHSLWFSGLSGAELRKVLQIGGCGPDVIRKLSPGPLRNLNWPNIAALAVWLVSVGTLLACAARSRKHSSNATS